MKKKLTHYLIPKWSVYGVYVLCRLNWLSCGLTCYYDVKWTTNKKQVTCKNCKRTKLFRGVK